MIVKTSLLFRFVFEIEIPKPLWFHIFRIMGKIQSWNAFVRFHSYQAVLGFDRGVERVVSMGSRMIVTKCNQRAQLKFTCLLGWQSPKVVVNDRRILSVNQEYSLLDLYTFYLERENGIRIQAEFLEKQISIRVDRFGIAVSGEVILLTI